MNKVIILGNIVKDLEIKKTTTGKSVLEFSIAVNEGSGDKKTTEYINCVAWEKLADIISQFCSKGSKVLAEGRIKTDSYEKNGEKKYRTYVLLNTCEFIQTKKTDAKEQTPNNRIEIKDDELPFY